MEKNTGVKAAARMAPSVREIIEALTRAEDILPKKEPTRMEQYLQSLPGSIPAKAVFEGKAYNEEREQVRFFRMNGKTCTEIAREMGIPEALAVSYCNELGLPPEGSCHLVEPTADERQWFSEGMRDVPLGRLCPTCGQEVHQPRNGGRKVFCSDRCRYRWRDSRPKEQSAMGRTVACENCGRSFVATKEYTRKRRFCSRDCYFEHKQRIASTAQRLDSATLKESIARTGDARLDHSSVLTR